jgi:hypothetical protein
MTTAPSKSVIFTPVVQNSHTYSMTFSTPGGDATITYVSDASATAAEISLGLVTAINANGLINPTVTAVDNTGTLTVNTDVAGATWTHVVTRADLTQDDLTVDPGSVANLTAIGVFNNDWYTVHPTWHSSLGVVALSVYIETLKKILITESADDDILAGTGLGAALKASGYARTSLAYIQRPGDYPGAAWAGKILPLDPGSATWKFKTLAGVTVDTGFTTTQQTNMRADSVNFYQAIAGVSMMEEGVSASGEFLDVTQGIDWLSQIMAEDVFALLASSPKIPFTDPGIQAVEAIIRADLNLAIAVGFLAASPAPVVTVPLAADVSAIDKANRFLPDLNFSATLAGAVHSLEITGTVSV